jgi:hypothetical protein
MLDRMLTRPDGAKAFTARCDQCGLEAFTDEDELEAAREVMTQAGWQERARAGKGVAGAHWICQSCKPKPPSTLGRSTPGDAPPSSG